MAERAVFVADVHLSPDDPEGVRRFTRFIESQVAGDDSLFILGDLFDLWCGPAQLSLPAFRPVLDALRHQIDQGTRVTILHGNRDFLLDRREALALDEVIPGEIVVEEIQGSRVVLTHGDLFCTRDRAYQRMKRIIRSKPVRWLVAILPSRLIFRLARLLRRQARKALSAKPKGVLSLQLAEVEAIADRHGADIVICGHFHAARDTAIGNSGRLIVLSGWDADEVLYVRAEEGSFELLAFQG